MPSRRYLPAQIGDHFGERVVVAILPRDGTSNERVRVRDSHGHERDAYVFNLRKGRHTVDHEQRRLAVMERHEKGDSTSQIARDLQLEPSAVSTIKTKAGVGAGVPSVRLLAAIDHTTVALEATAIHIGKLMQETVHSQLTAAPEEIAIWLKRMKKAVREIGNLRRYLESRR